MAEAHSFARKQPDIVQKRQKCLYDMKLNEKVYSEGNLLYRLNEAPAVADRTQLQVVVTLERPVLSYVLRSSIVHHHGSKEEAV